MDLEAKIKDIETIRDYEVLTINHRAIIKLIEVRNLDISEQIEKLNLMVAGETDIPLREVVRAMSDDLDEIEYLMAKRKETERKLDGFKNGVKEEE